MAKGSLPAVGCDWNSKISHNVDTLGQQNIWISRKMFCVVLKLLKVANLFQNVHRMVLFEKIFSSLNMKFFFTKES